MGLTPEARLGAVRQRLLRRLDVDLGALLAGDLGEEEQARAGRLFEGLVALEKGAGPGSLERLLGRLPAALAGQLRAEMGRLLAEEGAEPCGRG